MGLIEPAEHTVIAVLVVANVVCWGRSWRKAMVVRRLAVGPRSTVRSTPPCIPPVARPPADWERDVVAATTPLLLTVEEKVAILNQMNVNFARLMDAIPLPSELVEMVCVTRWKFFDWIAGDDDELAAEWWDCVEGVGRWER